jgi:oligoendopeptidase F
VNKSITSLPPPNLSLWLFRNRLFHRVQILDHKSNRLLFFDLWFKKQISEESAHHLIDSVPSVYKEFLRHKRLLAKRTLTEPAEKIISALEVTGTSALVKIYDRMCSGFEFIVAIKKGKRIVKRKFSNKEKILSMVRSPRAEEREAAYQSLLGLYRKNSGILGEIYLNRIIQWHDENINMRGFETPISVRNVYNNLDDITVKSLLAVCRRNSSLFQEYFKEKARVLRVKSCTDIIYTPHYH